MKTRNTRPVLAQEDFEMYAELAASKKERAEHAKREVEKKKRGYHPVPEVETVEEAYRIAGLVEEQETIKQELQDLAEEMKAAGMPKGVWIKHARKPSSLDATSARSRGVRLQLLGTDQNPTLAVEFL